MPSIAIYLIVFVCFIFWIYSIVSVVKLLKPFQEKWQAILGVVITPVMVGVVAFSGGLFGSKTTEVKKPSTIQTIVVENQANSPIPALSEVVNIESVEVEKITEQAANSQEDAISLDNIRTAIVGANFTGAKLFAVNNSDVTAANAEELESLALEIIRPLPASMGKANKEGYELLMVLNRDNGAYAKKAAYYAEQIQLTDKRQRTLRFASFKKKTDETNGTTIYTHKNAPKYSNSRSTISPYIWEKDGQLYLKVQVQYTASKWLFVKEVRVNTGTGATETFFAGTFRQDNDTSIWEWINVTSSPTQLAILRRIAGAPSVKLKFEGEQHSKDIYMRSGDIQLIRETLALYDFLNENS